MTQRPNASTLGIMLLLSVGGALGCATGTSMLKPKFFTSEIEQERRLPRETVQVASDPMLAPATNTATNTATDSATESRAASDAMAGVDPASHIRPIRQSAGRPGSYSESYSESYSVARTPSMVGPQFVDPSSQTTHTEGACCGNAHGPYRPLFPNRIGGRLMACKGGCQVPHAGPCPQGPCEPQCEEQSRCMDPQEYIYDGGDRDPPVRLREDLSQVGLDPEDTVIQYTTKTGLTEVQAGCRVAIYAPRFGSVRKRTGVLESELALRPQTADVPAGPGMIKEKLPPIQVSAPLKANTKDTVRVVEAFLDRQRPMPAELVLPMGEISDAFKPYEDLDIIRNGNVKNTDPAKLAIAAAAARIWSNIDALAVLIDGQEAAVIVDQKQAREFTLYEYKGARVRICKVASEQIANPGDIVSFTIRYDNIGEQPVSSLVVTDSLAPRLEYIESSQQSSIEARFSTSPNDAGSSVLRWEIDKELKPGEGGFVRFDAKVR